MKKLYIILLVAVLYSFQSFGQFSFGIKAGSNLSDVKGIFNPTRIKAGIYAGLLTEVVVSKKFIVRPELLYSEKGIRIDATIPPYGHLIYKFNYISIPLLVGYRPINKLTIFLGPEFNFLTNAKAKFDSSSNDNTKYYRKFDMAIDLGATYEIKYGLGAELRYSYGFEDMLDAKINDFNGTFIRDDRIGSHRVIQLGLFYKFSKK